MLSGNHFPPDPRVWQLRKVEFFGNWNQFDQNFTPLTRKWFYTFILPSNHFRVTRKREREQERERERERKKRAFAHDRSRHKESWARRDRPKLWSPRSFAEITRSVDRDRANHRSRSCEAPRRSRSRLRADRDLTKHRVDCSPSSNSVTSLCSFFSQFDRIWWFFSGFCLCFCIEEWMILYICLAIEKMWATSRKCVFYGIFNNTTKH